MNRHVRDIPRRTRASPCAFILASAAAGSRIALRVPLEVEARLHVPRRASVERQHVAGNPALAQLAGDRDRFLRRAVVRLRHPQPESPQRNVGRAAGELRVALDDLRGIAAADQEQIQRFVVDDDAVGAMRPVGMADAVRDAAGRVDEDAPRALAARPDSSRTARSCRTSPVLTPSASSTCEWTIWPRLLSGPNFSPSP